MAPMNVFLTSVAMLFSQEDFHLYYAVDRMLYTVLVMNLWRDPDQSLNTISFWLWLEQYDLSNVIKRILALPANLINELANEATICLMCIHNPEALFTPEASEIPLTHSLIKKDISLHFFRENRDLVFHGLAKIDSEICVGAFSDIREDAIARNNSQRFAELENLTLHQSLVNGYDILAFQNNNKNVEENQLVPAEERTMFVTFSRGYPVAEQEVRNFFSQWFGDCIEYIYMQDVRGTNAQALFARIVFFRVEFIHMILKGNDKAKFTINGKHIWMRQYVPKRPRIPSPPQLPENPFDNI